MYIVANYYIELVLGVSSIIGRGNRENGRFNNLREWIRFKRRYENKIRK